jgi:hypothetical protein
MAADYRDYDRNWLSEIVILAVAQHQVAKRSADVEREGRVKLLISQAGKAPPQGTRKGPAVGTGRANSQGAV